MPRARLASLNAEWMNDFFGPDADPMPAFRTTGERDGAFNVARAAERLAGLLQALDASVVALQEAPSRGAELELFLETYLRGGGGPSWDYLIGDSGGAQKVAVIFRAPASARLVPSDAIAEILTEWEADVDGDGRLEPYGFTRSPLVVEISLGGKTFELIVAHLKSNFVNQGEELWNDPARRGEYVSAALKARRRISSEGMRIRRYLDRRLAAEPDARIAVVGDLNDGPGLDWFEERYLTHNVTDILVGSAFEPERVFLHAQHDVPAESRFTAVFDDFVTGEKDRRLLLDHILLSPGLGGGTGLRRAKGSGRVEHDAWAGQVAGKGAARDRRPTDHRPVSVELRY